jgi:hypothetical protein
MRLAVDGALVAAASILFIAGMTVRGAGCYWCDVFGGSLVGLGCIAAVGLVSRRRPR